MLETIKEPFLGMPGINFWLFSGLSIASMVTAFVGAVAGTAGGLILIAIMAFIFPPSLLIPLHTLVQLGASSSMLISRWQYFIRGTLLPFCVGTAFGGILGGRIFITLSETTISLILGVGMLILVWIPTIARFGPEKGRFVFVGFITTFLGVFISATGSLLAAFTAAAATDRRNHIATLGGLMSIVHITKLIVFGVLGVEFGTYAPLIISMIATSWVGVFLGGLVLDKIEERYFRILFQTILTILSIRLIVKALGWPIF